MAITTLDGAIAGMQPTRFFFKAITPTTVAGKPQSLWGLQGIPGIGVMDSTLPGVVLSSTSANVNGQLPWIDPGSGNSYLARFVGDSTANGKLLLCDRLWHNGGYSITSTSVQSTTSPTYPARDMNGATNGVGVLLGLEVSSACGAAAPTIAVQYTNSSGVTNRAAGFAFATANSPATGSFFPIALQTGDVGVQALQSVQLSTSWISGVINMVAYRVIASLELPAAANAIDLVTGGMSQFFNGSVPFLIFIPAGTTACYVSGALTVTQG